jgi:hypothetical protein
MIRMVAGERGREAALPRPLRLEVAFHHPLPLETRLRAEVEAGADVWQSRILMDERPLIDATLRPGQPFAPLAPALHRAWTASPAGTPVPRYEWCLACGRSNPRSARLRFEYTEDLVGQRLDPPSSFRSRDGSLALGYFCIVGDELGWWLGALRQGECGLSSRLTVTIGTPVRFGTALLALGARAAVGSADAKGRLWNTQAAILTADGNPVATAEVQFAGSRAFTRTMLPCFILGDELPAVQRAFPRYAEVLAAPAPGQPGPAA